MSMTNLSEVERRRRAQLLIDAGRAGARARIALIERELERFDAQAAELEPWLSRGGATPPIAVRFLDAWNARVDASPGEIEDRAAAAFHDAWCFSTGELEGALHTAMLQVVAPTPPPLRASAGYIRVCAEEATEIDEPLEVVQRAVERAIGPECTGAEHCASFDLLA